MLSVELPVLERNRTEQVKPVLSATQSEQEVGGRSRQSLLFNFKEEIRKVPEKWSSEKEAMKLGEGKRFQGLRGWKIACHLLFSSSFCSEEKKKNICCFVLLFLQVCSLLLQRCILFICNHSLWGIASCISTGHWRMWAYIYVNLVSYLFGTKCSCAQISPVFSWGY